MRSAFVYSPDYDFRLPAFSTADAEASLHRFTGLRAVRAWRLLEEGGAIPERNRVRPRPVTEEELLAVHPASYLATLTSSRERSSGCASAGCSEAGSPGPRNLAH